MIYLSICIPTYNRSGYLRDTIESIIAEPEFVETDEVEIVISDNCSTDDTAVVVNEYVSKFPSKIKYSKNQVNILDRNYEKVLSLGGGEMLKLHNDTLIVNPGSLRKMLTTIKDCLAKGMMPFFLNGEMKEYCNSFECSDAISFISKVSYRCTWIGGFVISKKAFEGVDDFSSKAALMLTQVNVLFELLKKGNSLMVIPEKLFTSITPAKKGGYNLPTIFLTNYFQILSPFFLSEDGVRALSKEKKRILYKFVLPWLVQLKRESLKKTSNFSFDRSNYKQTIKKEFPNLTYYSFQAKLAISNALIISKQGIKSIIGFR